MIKCKQCGEWVPNDFNSKMEHMYYEHADMFISAFLEAIRPVKARAIGRRIAEYFNESEDNRR